MLYFEPVFGMRLGGREGGGIAGGWSRDWYCNDGLRYFFFFFFLSVVPQSYSGRSRTSTVHRRGLGDGRKSNHGQGGPEKRFRGSDVTGKRVIGWAGPRGKREKAKRQKVHYWAVTHEDLSVQDAVHAARDTVYRRPTSLDPDR
jgi:hypothetical protein